MKTMEFQNWMLAEAVATRTTSGVGAPPAPPFDDDGDNDDHEEWEWDNVIKKYARAIQQWADTDPFAKKCKGAMLGKIFSGEPEIEVNLYTSEDDEVPAQSYAEMEIKWSVPEGNLPAALFQALRDPRQCTLWKPLGFQPAEWYATIDKGDLFDVVWHLFAMSLAGVNLTFYLEPRDATKTLASNAQWAKDKQTLEVHAGFRVWEMSSQLEERVRDEVHDHWIMGRKTASRPIRGIRARMLGQKSYARYREDSFLAEVRQEYSYQVIT